MFFNKKKSIVYFVKPYSTSFIFIIFLAIIEGLLQASQPIFIHHIIDNFILTKDIDKINTYVILFCLFIFLQFLAIHFYIRKASGLSQKIIYDIRIKLFQHIQSLDIKYFDKTPLGSIVDIQTNELDRLSNFFTEGCTELGVELIKIIILLIIMFYINVQLAFIGLILVFIFIFIIFVFQKRIKIMFSKGLTVWSDLSTFINEHITGISIIQIFNNENKTFEKFKIINKSHRDINIDTELYYSIYFPVTELLISIGTILIITIGSVSIINEHSIGQTSLGTLISFIIFFGMLFSPITISLFKLNTFQLGVTSFKRIFSFLNEQSVNNNNGKISPIEFKGGVKFDKVWFSYKNDDYIIKGISFEIIAGQKIGIVGKTGSGKSTIINLISRFYEINKGHIYLDNIPLNDLDIKFVRKNIGIVQQDTFLFSTSIRDNITLFDSNILDEQIWMAIEKIGCKSFIDGLQDKLDYKISENGSNLSGGEKQLICILRCILYNPKIIIFDESTASLDAKYEKLIQNALEIISRDKTTISIAHRLSTIKKADVIFVMNKGEIIESGTHSELINLKGHYKLLYDYQV